MFVKGLVLFDMNFTEIIGLVAGTCTSSALVPQLIKTIKKKKAADLSLLMLFVLLAGNSLWVYYGFERSIIPIIATNIFALILNIIMLVLKFKYSPHA